MSDNRQGGVLGPELKILTAPFARKILTEASHLVKSEIKSRKIHTAHDDAMTIGKGKESGPSIPSSTLYHI